MAASFYNRVKDYIGDRPSTISQLDWFMALSEWLTAAAREIFELIPITRLRTQSSDVDDIPLLDIGNDLYGFDVSAKRIISVSRDGYPATEIDSSMLARYSNANSLYQATNRDPVYYITEGYLKVLPNVVVTGTEKTGDVHYIESPTVAYDASALESMPVEYDTLVVLGAAIRARVRQLVEKRNEMPDALDIATITIPSITPGDLETMDDTLPTFSAPAAFTLPASLAAADIDWDSYGITDETLADFPAFTLGDGVVAPDITVPSVDISGFTAPTIVLPSFETLDWDDVDTWISTEEDSEMSAARLQDIQAKIGKYGNDLQAAQALFSETNTQFQADIQEAMQNAQLESAAWSQKIQGYSTEVQTAVQTYQADVQKYTQNITNALQVYQTETGYDIQKYSADLQGETARFSNDMTLALQTFQQGLAKYSMELQRIAQDNQTVLGQFGSEMQTYSSEIGAKVQEFNGNVQKVASEYGFMTQELQALQGQYTQGLQILTQGQQKSQGPVAEE